MSDVRRKRRLRWACAISALSVGLGSVGVALASTPSLQECLEGSDFIANAARARDAGTRSKEFLSRMESDFVLVHAFPSEFRWFVHDADDEVFLMSEARDVYAHPFNPEQHREVFLRACMERMGTSASAPTDPAGDAKSSFVPRTGAP